MHVDRFPIENLLEAMVAYCPSCNQVNSILLQAAIGHRYKNGQVMVDHKSFSRYLEFLNKYFKDLAAATYYSGPGKPRMRENNGVKSWLKELEFISNEVIQDWHGDDPEHFRDVWCKSALMVCPNCGSEMVSVQSERENCESRWEAWEEYCFCMCPGCYICTLETSWEYVMDWCARCHIVNTKKDKTPDCASCIFKISKEHFKLKDHEIQDHAKQVVEGGNFFVADKLYI